MENKKEKEKQWLKHREKLASTFGVQLRDEDALPAINKLVSKSFETLREVPEDVFTRLGAALASESEDHDLQTTVTK